MPTASWDMALCALNSAEASCLECPGRGPLPSWELSHCIPRGRKLTPKVIPQPLLRQNSFQWDQMCLCALTHLKNQLIKKHLQDEHFLQAEDLSSVLSPLPDNQSRNLTRYRVVSGLYLCLICFIWKVTIRIVLCWGHWLKSAASLPMQPLDVFSEVKHPHSGLTRPSFNWLVTADELSPWNGPAAHGRGKEARGNVGGAWR